MENEDREIVLMEGEYENEPVFLYAHNEAMHSAVFLKKGMHFDPVFPYARIMCNLTLAKEEKEDVLLIGGAGYSMPKYLISQSEAVRMDVVDNDPTVYDTALAFFYLQELIDLYHPDENGRLIPITADGREYLEDTEKLYDVILDDAYDGVMPVLELLTVQSARAAKAHLKKNGLFLANIPGYSEVQAFPLTADIVRTYASVFRYVYLIDAHASASEYACNYVLAASDVPVHIAETVGIDLKDAVILQDEMLGELKKDYVF